MKRVLRTRYKFFILVILFVIMVVSIAHSFRLIFKKNSYHTINDGYITNLTLDEDKKYFGSVKYNDSVIAYNNRQYELAIDKLNEEIQDYPGHAQAYFLLGKIYEDIENREGKKYFKRMLNNYERYIELKPNGKRADYAKLRVAQYYVQAGLMQKNTALLDRAEAYLQSLDKTDSSVRMALGAIYLDKENYDKAISEFEKSANLEPDELKIKYNSLGLAYIKKGSLANAEKFLSIAVKIDPKDKYAHNNLGFVYAQQGKLQDAQMHFTQAVKLDSTYDNAAKNLSWVERELAK